MKRLPTTCPCGKAYVVDHALSCAKGGFIHQRHDRVRDFFAKTMSEVHKDVATEPALMPLTGEHLHPSANTANDARLDVSVRWFWQGGQRAFFDIRVFNPFAPSHLTSTLQKNFERNEKEKKRLYNQRVIEMEHGSFSPLVFTPYGGASRETELVIKTLSAKVACKRNLEYSTVTNWIRSKISFILLKLAILCIRGSRDWKSSPDLNFDDIELSEYM